MAKYLDRKAVLKVLKALLADENDYSDLYHDGYVDGVYDAEDAVRGLPSEDVVKVVRCKDCKWSDWYTAVDGKQYCCCMETGASARTETDYCSFAERDGEQNGRLYKPKGGD